MAKQGMYSTITKLVLIALFFTILITVFFASENSIFGSVKRMIPNINDWVSRDGGRTNDMNTREAQDMADKAAVKIMQAYEQLANDPYDKGCFYYLPAEDIEFLQKYELEITDTGTGISIVLYRPRGAITDANLAGGSSVSSKTVANVNPCLVYSFISEAPVQAFYNFYLAGKYYVNANNHFTPVEKYYITGEDIVVAPSTANANTELDLHWYSKGDAVGDKSPPFVLYKFGRNICMFPAERSFLTLSCKTESVRIDGKRVHVLSNDCFSVEKNPSIYNIRASGEKYAIWNGVKCEQQA